MSNQVSETEQIATSLLPLLDGDGFDAKRAEYLSKRVCNFTMREACKLADVSEKSVRRWREADPEFHQLDTEGMTDLRKQLSAQYVDIEFTRNFHLVMQKDFKILYKDATEPDKITEAEANYLNKIRQHYTPQSLAMVKQLVGGGTVDKPFDFTKLTLEIKREQITIVQESNNGE